VKAFSIQRSVFNLGLESHFEALSLAPEAREEGSQTWNVWKERDKHLRALETREEKFFARLQRAILLTAASPDVSRPATFSSPLRGKRRS
jgi:hypothetical protein